MLFKMTRSERDGPHFSVNASGRVDAPRSDTFAQPHAYSSRNVEHEHAR